MVLEKIMIAMGRYKSLALNTAIFGICSFTSKLLVFLMLPFYTSVLSKEEFGTSDLISTIVGLIVPILTLSVSHGCMRFALDKSKNIKQVFSFGLKITLLGVLLLFIAYPIILQIPIICDYSWAFVLLYVSQTLHSFTGLFARGMSKVKMVGVAGVVSSFVVVLSNVIFLFVFHMGVNGYLLSMIISHLCFSLILILGCRMYRLITMENDSQLNKEILTYSLPIIPNSLSWWIQHSANRYILNYYCGVAEVGLYSAASKVPTIIDTFRGIFVQAWQLSTIEEYDKEGAETFFKKIFSIYNVFLLIICIALLLCSKVLAQILYSKDFYDAWVFTPLLIVGVLFSSMVAFYSPTYLAHKKTNKLFLSTLLGAIITVVGNFAIIPIIGPLGAAVSTVLSNIVIFIYLFVDSQKYTGYRLGSWRLFSSYTLILLIGVLITFADIEPFCLLTTAISLVILVLNKSDVCVLFDDISKLLKKKIRKI